MALLYSGAVLDRPGSRCGRRRAAVWLECGIYPLGGGGTFQCNGTAVPAISKNICSSTGFLADITEDGTLTSFRTPDTTGVYEAPKS